jgi:UDP-N-acetylmuramoylalanine--D-glutamate ligase
MNDWKAFFKDKRVTVMGLGLLGRGVGDVAFLATYAKEVLVTDMKPAKDLKESLDKLKKFKNIRFTLGEHKLEDFEHRDFVVKAAGVPLDSPYIAHAKKHKVPVYMSTALFAHLAPAKIVGVTGTRGKTTVTYMLYEILKARKKGRVFLGGNVQGVATLPMLPKVKKGDTVVLELDSWQLQGFGDLTLSPSLSVFTTFMPDHLNYYKGDLKKYFADKANIFKFQRKGDVLVAGKNLAKMPKNAVRVLAQDLPKNIILQIAGEHNRFNAALAFVAARKLGVPVATIKKTLENFKGVPGRLQKVRTLKGIDIYNDTTATTPHALSVALEALKDKNVVLIAGGSEKNIDLKILKKPLSSCKAIILLPGKGTDRLVEEKIVEKFVRALDMKEAVKLAWGNATKGDTILLSPGFASFGLFKNEYDRGDQFNAFVRKLK